MAALWKVDRFRYGPQLCPLLPDALSAYGAHQL
jgi:hypothetical protein